MEEILASIKRVIAEDNRSTEDSGARRPSSDIPVEGDEDVLELSEPAPEQDPLMSTDAAAASRERLAALAALRQRAEDSEGGPLEAVVRDMLRPILKQWLDQHLPQIVEELVTREITRITGKNL